MTIRITILGCGNSTGVPSADGQWGTCDPTEPRNRRLRSSILVQKDDTTVLVAIGDPHFDPRARHHDDLVDADRD